MGVAGACGGAVAGALGEPWDDDDADTDEAHRGCRDSADADKGMGARALTSGVFHEDGGDDWKRWLPETCAAWQ